MPLIQGKSKKAFSKNVAKEMEAGKPQPQALAIAYSVKRKNKRKKMAEGGMANESAASESRPMPEERDKDAAMVSRNSGKKPAKNDNWLDQPTVAQAKANDSRKVMPIKHPKMVPQNSYSVRLRDEEDALQSSASVNDGPQRQPPEHDNEMGPNRQGPKVRDMEAQHNNHRKPYAKGGPVMEPEDHEMELQERNEEAHMQSALDPSEDEGASFARRNEEIGQNRQGPQVPDMEDEHSTGRKPYAGGGRIGDSEENMDHEMELNPAHDKHSPDDSEMQPHEEAEEERHNSIAAAIMAKRDRMHADIDSGVMDLDEAVRMASGGSVESGSRDMNYAEGGEIHSHDSIYSDDSDQVDLSRNADEDANEEDQLSFNALRKENYSESEGLKQLNQPRNSNLKGDEEEDESENKHDMVSAIRSKMNVRRQFKDR